MIAPSDGSAAADDLVASMMSVGLDLQAARWVGTVTTGGPAWGLLAVGAAQPPFSISDSEVRSYRGGDVRDNNLRTKFLFAGLAGLGRLSSNAVDLCRRHLLPRFRRRWKRRILCRRATTPVRSAKAV